TARLHRSRAGVETFVHAQVTLIPAEGYFICLHGVDHRTARFIDMSAIIESALIEPRTHFHKIMGKLLAADVVYSKFPDSGRVYQVPSAGQFKHFSEGGGVRPLTRKIGYGSGFQVQTGN